MLVFLFQHLPLPNRKHPAQIHGFYRAPLQCLAGYSLEFAVKNFPDSAIAWAEQVTMYPEEMSHYA